MSVISLDQTTPLTTIISVFDVDPERQPQLMELLTANSEWLRHQPGFISAGLHVSADGGSVINYAQWRDEAAVRSMLTDPSGHEHAAAVREIATVRPLRCTLTHIVTAR